MSPRFPRWLPIVPSLLLLLAGIGWALLSNPVHEQVGIDQARLTRATLPLAPHYRVSQTFVSPRAGLKALDVLLVVYSEPPRQRPSSGHLILTLERLGGDAASVTVSAPVAKLQHNQRVRFDFPVQRDTEGVLYRATLHTDSDYGLGVWYAEQEAYADGDIEIGGMGAEGDLCFTTYHDYSLSDALRDAGRMMGRYGRYLSAVALVFGLPGYLLALYLIPAGRLDLWSFWGLAVALSVTTWALLLQWASAFRVSLAGGTVWALVALWLGVSVWSVRQRDVGCTRGPDPSLGGPELVMGLLLLVVMVSRLVQVRDLVIPAWVDSVHHVELTQRIASSGMVPSGDSYYHLGFHSVTAALMWFTNLSAPDAVMLTGQIFNAFAPLASYTLATRLTDSRWAGVGAAVVVGALSYMPAYYVTWGRYTHLAGLVLLPFAAMVLDRLLCEDPADKGWRATLRPLLLSGLLAAGVALTHYRALVFYSLYAMVVAGRGIWRALQTGRGGLRLLYLVAMTGALSLLAIVPTAERMLFGAIPSVGSLFGGWALAPEQNAFPLNLLRPQPTWTLLWVALAGVLWGIVRRRAAVVAFAVWCGLCILAANLDWFGLPALWLTSRSSLAISYWLPMGVLCGWFVSDLVAFSLERLSRRWPTWPWRRSLEPLAAVLALTLVGWGCWAMVDIVNPATVLATADDLHAMDWVAENTPLDARFLVNTRQWSGDIHAGEDAGWWLPVLTGRAATMPSLLHAMEDPSRARAVTELALTVEHATSLSDPVLCRRLAQEGVTHVYIGARGGRLNPEELDRSPCYHMVYSYGPVRVYELRLDAVPTQGAE